jgi:hypothetical protein
VVVQTEARCSDVCQRVWLLAGPDKGGSCWLGHPYC